MLSKKKKGKGETNERGALQVRADNDKEKEENRKTEQNNLQEEQYQSQITSRADIMVRKVWYELKRRRIG